MPSLAQVAWGLILVYVDFRLGVFDVLPDLLGWVLVLLGLGPLNDRSGGFRLASVAAWAGLVGSLLHLVSPPTALGAFVESVAQTVVCVGICTAVLGLVADPLLRRRAEQIRTWTVGLSLAVLVLVLVTGGETEAAGPLVPVVLAGVAVGLVLMVVWVAFLFRLAKLDASPAPPLLVA